MPILELRDVVYSYPQGEDRQPGPPAVAGVSLSVEEGEFVAVLGHNGSGKSTLAKLFNAILLPTSGDVLVGGMNTRDENRLFDIRKTAGMVFQNPDNQIVATVVEEDVAFAPENMGLPPKEIRRRVDESLAAVGMSEFKRHAPHLLSGGQKQRIAIAGVLAMQPRAIIMDEPTANLDYGNSYHVMERVAQLGKDGYTVIFSSHDPNQAFRHATRVLALKDGSILADGPSAQVLTEPVLSALYGIPVAVRSVDIGGTACTVSLPGGAVKR